MKYSLRNKIDPYNFLEDFLNSKGIKDSFAFIHADAGEEPALLENIEEAVVLLHDHLQEKSKISVIVDDDADGLLSSSLIYYFFKELKSKSSLDFLFHDSKFHGIEVEAVLASKCQLLIVPDAGSSDIEQQDTLTAENIDILILDHHQVSEHYEGKGRVVLVNNQTSALYSNKDLCGTGVVYKFLQYYNEKYNCGIELTKYLDLVAIATVGDVMGLDTLENRYFLNVGLKNIQNPFFKRLVASKEYSMKSIETINPVDVSFNLIPAINAIIRVGTVNEKKLVFDAITKGDVEVASTKRGKKPGDIEILTEQAIRICNNAVSRQRRERLRIAEILQKRVLEELGDKNKVIIGKYYEEDKFNSSLTGLAAMELASHFRRPALVLKFNEQEETWSGSGRNFEGYVADLRQFLVDSNLVNYASGHPGAFGISIPDEHLDSLINYINEADYSSDYSYLVDVICNPNDSNLRNIIQQVDSHRYLWGNKVEEPIICVENIFVNREDVVQMGANKDSVKFVKDGVAYVRFKDLDYFNEITENDTCILTIIGKANVNYWNGGNIPQIMVEHYMLQDRFAF